MTDPQDVTAKKKELSDTTKALANSLIGGAFGLIGLAIFASASYADKVDPGALTLGNAFSVAASGCFLASIYLGGRGLAGMSAKPFKNPFNVQSWLGIVGILLLLAASITFAFNPKTDPDDAKALKIEARVVMLESKQRQLESELAASQAKLAEVIAKSAISTQATAVSASSTSVSKTAPGS